MTTGRTSRVRTRMLPSSACWRPVGIIYMDFAGMDKSPDYSSTKLYNTVGMKLVDAVIKQN